MTVETGDTFSFDRLAPADGATPAGSESLLPLPPDTHRILTAEIEQSPFSLRVYESRLSPHAVLAFYAVELHTLGFTPVDEDRHMYARGSAQVIVMAREEGEDHYTVVSLGEAAN